MIGNPNQASDQGNHHTEAERGSEDGRLPPRGLGQHQQKHDYDRQRQRA
jgi:hypothetical protein